MTKLEWWLAAVCTMGLAACATADASPPDGGAPKKKAAKRAPAAEPEEGPTVPLLPSDDQNRGLGRFGMQPYAECVPAEDAAKRTKRPPQHGGDGIGGGVGVGEADPSEQSKAIAECPSAIWVYVGAGHASRPIGDVSTPLVVGTTRKRRRHHPHDCCYLVQNAPGSPNG